MKAAQGVPLIASAIEAARWPRAPSTAHLAEHVSSPHSYASINPRGSRETYSGHMPVHERADIKRNVCRRTGNQGTQTCLSAAHVAFLVRPGRAQLIDQLLKTFARGPTLARRTTKTSSGSGLT